MRKRGQLRAPRSGLNANRSQRARSRRGPLSRPRMAISRGFATIYLYEPHSASELSFVSPNLTAPAKQKVSTDSRTRATTASDASLTLFGTPAIVFSNRCVQKAACGLSTTWLQNSRVCVALLQLARVAVPPGPARVAPLVCAAKERPHTTLCPRTRDDDHRRELERATTLPLHAHD